MYRYYCLCGNNVRYSTNSIFLLPAGFDFEEGLLLFHFIYFKLQEEIEKRKTAEKLRWTERVGRTRAEQVLSQLKSFYYIGIT